MTCQKTEIIFLGRSNTIDWLFTEDGLPYSLANCTKIILEFSDGTTVEDEVAGSGNIVWDEAITEVEGKVILTLGGVSFTSTGELTCRVTIFDPAHPNGAEFSGQDGIPFYVIAAPA